MRWFSMYVGMLRLALLSVGLAASSVRGAVFLGSKFEQPLAPMVLHPTATPPCAEEEAVGAKAAIAEMDPEVFHDPSTQALAKAVAEETMKAVRESAIPVLRAKAREAVARTISLYMPTTAPPTTTTTLTTTNDAQALHSEVEALRAEQRGMAGSLRKEMDEVRAAAAKREQELTAEVNRVQAELAATKARYAGMDAENTQLKEELERLRLMAGSVPVPGR